MIPNRLNMSVFLNHDTMDKIQWLKLVYLRAIIHMIHPDGSDSFYIENKPQVIFTFFLKTFFYQICWLPHIFIFCPFFNQIFWQNFVKFFEKLTFVLGNIENF